MFGRNRVAPGRPDGQLGRRHLLWIPCAAALGFLSSFVFADVLRLSVAGYHLAYFALVATFFAVYTIRTGLRVFAVVRRRLPLALSLGVLGWLVLTRRVLADPPGSGSSGLLFAWDLFPWLVVWRALGGSRRPRGSASRSVCWPSGRRWS